MGEQDIQKDQPRGEGKETAFSKEAAAPMQVESFAIPKDKLEAPDFSNGIRLTGREWLIVGLFGLLIFLFASPLWKQTETFALEMDYRIPHDLSNDYWLYERHADQSAKHYDTVILGDSVVWGEYVTRDQTLSHYLNSIAGKERYANLGLTGAHPLALEGLVKYYGGSISGKNVVLQCNPLWLNSPQADLRDENATNFNHPHLVPQFSPHIPAYKEEMSPRLGVVVERHTSLSSWSNHLQQAYYNRTDIPQWTVDHPYDNPVKPLTRGLPPLDNTLLHLPKPWYESKITEQDYPWIDLNTSLQWHAFQRVVQILQQRGNHVFVLVGPFNEHLLTPESKQRYQGVKATITAWLDAQQIPNLAPPALASALYGDASHPLAAGYEMLARQMLGESYFQKDNR
jgi:hypothetical protein